MYKVMPSIQLDSIPKQSSVTLFLESSDRFIWQCDSSSFKVLESCVQPNKFELSHRIQDLFSSWNYFFSDSVGWNQSNCECFFRDWRRMKKAKGRAKHFFVEELACLHFGDLKPATCSNSTISIWIH